MPDNPQSILEQQRNKYIEDMNALQSSLESQTGILGKIFGAVGQFFTGFLPHVGKAILGIGPAIIEQFKWGMKESGRLMVEGAVKPAINGMISRGVISPELGKYVNEMIEAVGINSWFIPTIVGLLVIMGDVAGVLGVVIEDTRQKASANAQNTLPDLPSAIRAMMIDPALEEKVRVIMHRYGLSDERSDMMIAASRNQLDPVTLQALTWRGEITEEDLTARLRAAGYTDASAALLKKTWNIIPGPQDIIRMAVREAFSPEQVSALGLDEAFPAAVTEWAAKVGMKEPWPLMFWRAHWELPSPNMGYEMLHRGEITESELDALLKALDYSPRWHRALKNIAYNVVTRVDARRLYEMGIYDESKLDTAYRKMGYSPDDAADLVAWTKIEYAQTDKELTRAQIEKGYNARMITRAEGKRMLVTLGYSAERAEWLLDMADFSGEVKLRDEMIATMKINYMAGITTMSQVRQRLGEEEVDPAYIETLLEHWEAEKISQRRLPSKSDLDKFLKASLIAESEYKQELSRLGYSGEMADLYYRLNKGGSA